MDDGMQRSLGRIEGTLDQLLRKVDGICKGQEKLWGTIGDIKEELSDIKVDIAKLKNEKVGWRDLNNALKTVITIGLTLSGILLGIVIKGGV